MQNGSHARAVNFFLNSKGGVGKSHHAVFMVQAYRQAGQPVVAIDADATSATFFCYKALQVRRVPLMEGDDINPRVFDSIVEEILTTDANFVIDTGSSAFVELNRYLLRNGIPQHIIEGGKRFIANIIIAGGNLFAETCSNLKAIADQMPAEVEIVVWINDHFGPVVPAGRLFEDLEIYKMTQGRIAAVIQLDDHTFAEKQTFGADLSQMTRAGLTFEEVQASPDFTIMAKHRLKRVEQDLYGKFAALLGDAA